MVANEAGFVGGVTSSTFNQCVKLCVISVFRFAHVEIGQATGKP
jgi:hypothetical protein